MTAESLAAKKAREAVELLEARMHMVIIYLTKGEKPRAREEVERLRHEYPNDVGVHFVRGILARLDSQYDRALRSFERMVRLNPAELVVASYNRARIFMYRGRYDDALSELEQGAAMEPDHPLIRTFRARVLYYRGEVEAATTTLRTGDDEEVRELGHAEPEVGTRTVGPRVGERPSATTADVHVQERTADRVEAGREDDVVDLVQLRLRMRGARLEP